MSVELWFLDASAFVKLLKVEAESVHLERWMRGRDVASSDLLRTEARRAVAHLSDRVRQRCDELLAEVPMIRLVPAVLDRAGKIGGQPLRTLDAIYLACAEQLGDDLAGFVSYDHRQLLAVQSRGIRTASPGGAHVGDRFLPDE